MEHNNLTIKTYMTIMAERDAAIRERNMAIDERKKFLAERDMAMLQRDAALVERNSAVQERDEALAALRHHSMNENDPLNNNMIMFDDLALHQHHHPDDVGDDDNNFKMAGDPAAGTSRTVKVKIKEKSHEGPSKQTSTGTESNGWDNEDLFGDGDEQDSLGFNEVNFEEPTMPVPVCSCSGVAQPCYKWGNGGWQSSCCTVKLVDPFGNGSGKRGPRGGGRKMSGAVFNKLLNRLVDEGHDLFTPLDLKDHWAKHGTKRPGSSK